VSLVDLLGEEVGLGEHDSSRRRVVGQICRTSQTLGLDDRAVVLEETLVVSQVIREHIEVVADKWKSFGSWCISDGTTVDCDLNGSIGSGDVLECAESSLRIPECDACSSLVSQSAINFSEMSYLWALL
jgi:hypothetical protein